MRVFKTPFMDKEKWAKLIQRLSELGFSNFKGYRRHSDWSYGGTDMKYGPLTFCAFDHQIDDGFPTVRVYTGVCDDSKLGVGPAIVLKFKDGNWEIFDMYLANHLMK